MAEPLEIAAAAESTLRRGASLAGKRIILTSGPTHEPIDPVRYIANRSSGKQGHAIAAAAAAAGADVMLVSGPVNLPDPPGVLLLEDPNAAPRTTGLAFRPQAGRRVDEVQRAPAQLERQPRYPRQEVRDEQGPDDGGDPGVEEPR